MIKSNDKMIIQRHTQVICLFSLFYVAIVPITAFVAPQQPTQSSTHLFSDAVRAGEDGYSVMRQPAGVNWDPNVDPDFGVPKLENSVEDAKWLEQISTRRKTKDTLSVEEDGPTDASTIIMKPDDLDLFQRSLDTLDFVRILKALQDQCTTLPARKLVHQAAKTNTLPSKVPKGYERAYQPLTAQTVEDTQMIYQGVREMMWLVEGRDELDGYYFRNQRGFKQDLGPPPIQGFFAIDDLIEAAQERVLENEEILEIAGMMQQMENVQSWSEGLQRVENLDFVELPRIVESINVNQTLKELLLNAFDKDGRLSGQTFPKIGRLRAQVRTLKGNVISKIESLISLPSIRSKLALEGGGAMYSEVNGGRLVIPVEAKYASSIGIVHDTSRSGKTAFVEPSEIVGATNELRQTEGELRNEEARVWRSLTNQILNNRIALEGSVMAIGQLDLMRARLQLGNELVGVIPDVKDEGVITLRNAKHPVLLLRGVKNVVGSDVELGANGNQGIILTGPNSGGKTIILKLMGLMALMARSGIPVPCERATDGLPDPRVDFFNPVLADIGDLQSVGGDLSTFSGHMLVCREVLANSGRNALVLMDELGSGTDPNQGVAIAQALLEAILETGARVGITTHYLQLKQLATVDDRFSVAAMQFIKGRPTYKLLPGAIGESFALSVAERLELPQSVIDRATELLDSETRQMGDLIRELEDQKNLAEQKAAELERQAEEMRQMERQMKEEQAKLEQKQLTARREEARKFAKLLEEKEKVLEDVLEKLKTDPSRRVVARGWDDIKFVKRDVLNEAENIPSVLAQRRKQDAKMDEVRAELVPLAEMRERPDLTEGDKLIVIKKGSLFGREGVVAKMMGKNRVEVKVNNMNIALKTSEVALPNDNVDIQPTRSTQQGQPKRNSISKAAEKALLSEKDSSGPSQMNGEKAGPTLSIRTESNTVDVRGMNLEEAKAKAKERFSVCLMNNRPVVYILHGHGSGGVLKTKIRNWLKSERDLVKRWKPADSQDGGDAFTQVDLR